MRHVTHFIDGKPVAGSSGRQGPVFDPSTGQQQATVDLASADEVDAVVASARAAAGEWGETAVGRRSQVLFELRNQLRSRSDELATLISSEHGKTVDDARGEVARGLEVVELACGIPALLKGGFSENVSTRLDTYSLRQPVGVACGITPFNFPAMVPLWMLPLAIACGNAFILKPSERDPSASLVLAECASDAGLPPGVLNVLQGDRLAVDALLAHPGIDAVSFVGSTPIARHVYETAAAAGKRVQALGGAKNHMVVLDDADLGLAADAAVSAAFGSAGERCMAISVAVVADSVADAFVAAVVERTGRLRVGPGHLDGIDMGPLVTAEHRDRVAGYLDGAAADGATVVLDGRHHPVEGDPGGFYLGPTVLDHVPTTAGAYRDEVFGPVLCVLRAADLDEALAIVNASPYGNGTAIFTSDGGAARKFQHEVRAGMIGINVPIPVPVATYPFGGWKASLFGDTHVYGVDGIHFYTRGKVVTSRWPEAAHAGVRLAFPGTGATEPAGGAGGR
ncbi:MAG: CoA-acylating methylmalonate-semialdehyde dehydrogenase [Actinomycetota bacterium]|nr:CoA-acylating methylmalonate-semialdehyde dehydrogenase [Actinomycetota bacterium]